LSNITKFGGVPTFYPLPIKMQNQDFNQYTAKTRLYRLTSH
jgi:hypothetical protein